MTLAQLVAASILKATGEVSTTAEGDDDWNKILGIANFYIDTWANEPGIDWASLYNPGVSSGTVTATDTFPLDNSIRTISKQAGDTIRIEHVGGYTEYETVEPDRLKHYSEGNYCARVGNNLVFNKEFTADSPQFGGTIKVPSYLVANHLAAAVDVVPVDDPNWLVIMCAAEYVRNDLTRAQNYPNLIAEANNSMVYMKQANGAQVQTLSLSPVARGTEW